MGIYQYPLIISKNMKHPRNSSIAAVFHTVFLHRASAIINSLSIRKKNRTSFSDSKESKQGYLLAQYRRLMGGNTNKSCFIAQRKIIPTNITLSYKEVASKKTKRG